MGIKMDARAEAKTLLHFLFKVPRGHNLTTIDRVVDLIVKAAVEEVVEKIRNGKITCLPE